MGGRASHPTAMVIAGTFLKLLYWSEPEGASMPERMNERMSMSLKTFSLMWTGLCQHTVHSRDPDEAKTRS